jgi:large subunit ribosomal protein L21
MYAVFKACGQQFKVQAGQTLKVPRLKGEAGSKVAFDQVLLVNDNGIKIGTPLVAGASVEATIKAHTFNPKIIVFKTKRRKNYKKKRGHKQPMTLIEINKING